MHVMPAALAARDAVQRVLEGDASLRRHSQRGGRGQVDRGIRFAGELVLGGQDHFELIGQAESVEGGFDDAVGR